MGSGRNNRKDNDSPIIRRPKRTLAFTGNYGGSPGVAEIAAQVCPISFEVRLNKTQLTKEGVKVYLSLQNNIYHIKIANFDAGALNSQRSEVVKKCLGLGVHYSGVIVLRQDKVYARFQRNI